MSIKGAHIQALYDSFEVKAKKCREDAAKLIAQAEVYEDMKTRWDVAITQEDRK